MDQNPLKNWTLADLYRPENIEEINSLGESLRWGLLPDALLHAKELVICLQGMEFHEGIDHIRAYPPAPETIAVFIYVAHKELRSQKNTAAAKKNNGQRVSRYADEAKEWIKAARLAVSTSKASTTGGRKKDGVKAIQTLASHRTVSAFVKKNWFEIDSGR